MDQISITPEELASEAVYRLEEASDIAVAEQMQRYFKGHETVPLFGVKTPQRRVIEKKLFARVKIQWSYAEALAFCDILLSQSFHEPQAVGISLLARFHRSFEKALLRSIESWLSQGFCRNWAVVDAAATLLVTPFISKFPEMLPEIMRWQASDNLWQRRTAVVGLVKLARKGQLLDTAYDLAEGLFVDKEDLIQKAVGWLLKEAGKTDSAKLESFLLKHGSQIPRTTLRYAIEPFPKQSRKRILEETKSS